MIGKVFWAFGFYSKWNSMKAGNVNRLFSVLYD